MSHLKGLGTGGSVQQALTRSGGTEQSLTGPASQPHHGRLGQGPMKGCLGPRVTQHCLLGNWPGAGNRWGRRVDQAGVISH